ncbi:hypothetical protein IKQ21_07875 [bacterium]|nr:hypothetical protein [bacterium]
MLKVVIIGYGGMFTNLIAGTLDANCEIAGVFRNERIKYNPLIRKLKDIFNPSLDYNYIKSYNPHEIDAAGVNTEKFKKELLKLNPDIILVGSWGERISKEIYDLPKIATINAHPSLLPKYRGPNPYFWTIRNQEAFGGITFHLVTDEYDTGAILAQEEIKIFPSDTGESLKQRTVLTARGVVCELLKDLSEDIIIPLSQREDRASYYSHPSDLELDFRNSADENAALIRAIHPWGHAYFYHNTTCLYACHEGIEITDNDTDFKDSRIITSCDTKNNKIGVLCGDNKIIIFKVMHEKPYDRPFISNYLKNEITIGNIIV